MGHQLQTILALLAAAGAAAWLIARALSRRRRPGCGGDCGCADEPRAKALRRPGPE